MREILAEAIEYISGNEAVYFHYEDPDPEHPFGKGGGLFALYTLKSGRKAFRFEAPQSVRKMRTEINQLVRSMANNCGVVIFEDLHHIIRRCGDVDRLVFPEAYLDANFLYAFTARLDEQVDTIHLSRIKNEGPVKLIIDLWQENLPNRADRFFNTYFTDLMRGYARAENFPVRVCDDEGIPRNLYIQYNFNKSRTGRLSSKGSRSVANTLIFNAHQEPRRSRSHRIVADKKSGKTLLQCDYVAAEPRTIAALSGDVGLQKVMEYKLDPYALIAEKSGLKGADRTHGKAAFLRSLYGASPRTIAEDADVSQQDAQKLIDAAVDLFPHAYDYMEEVTNVALEDGYILTPMGRIIRLEDGQNPRKTMPNALIQSVTSDANTITFARIANRCKRVRPLIHIHDGYLLETQEQFAEDDAAFVREIMLENPIADFGVDLKLDCKVEITEKWLP